MTTQMTHERCSELLARFLAGELEPEEHRLVEDHLEHCAQCSAERAGLIALGSADQDEDLTGDERVELRAGVLEAIRDSETTSPLQNETDAVVVPLGGRGARAGKYLGIAALLAILAVGSLFVFRGGLGVTGGDDDSASTFGQAEDSGEGAGGEDADPGVSPEAAPEDGYRKGLRPRFQSDRGAISEADLDRLGRRVALTYSTSSDTAAASGTETEESKRNQLSDQPLDQTLGRLAARAPAALASEVAACGRRALEELDEPGLAVHATTATLDGRDVVAITFLTGGSPPDRYATFAFARGGCTTILASTEGPLE